MARRVHFAPTWTAWALLNERLLALPAYHPAACTRVLPPLDDYDSHFIAIATMLLFNPAAPRVRVAHLATRVFHYYHIRDLARTKVT